MKPILNKEMILEFISDTNKEINPTAESTLIELAEIRGRQQVINELYNLVDSCI